MHSLLYTVTQHLSTTVLKKIIDLSCIHTQHAHMHSPTSSMHLLTPPQIWSHRQTMIIYTNWPHTHMHARLHACTHVRIYFMLHPWVKQVNKQKYAYMHPCTSSNTAQHSAMQSSTTQDNNAHNTTYHTLFCLFV